MSRSMRRAVTAAVVLLSTAGSVTFAQAAPAFNDRGILQSTTTPGHALTVKDTQGDPALRGHTVTIYLTRSTRITRDGARSTTGALRVGDRVVSTGHRDARGRLVASQVDATSPPRPDGPAVAAAGTCVYYSCTPSMPPATATGSLTITISNYTFDPPVSVIAPGTLVTVRNTDGVAHTFSGSHLDSGSLGDGASFTVEFTTPGSYRFFCAIHPEMNGVIDVRS